MADQELTDQKLDAQLRETDARLSMLQSAAKARHAKEAMDEISGLRAARDRAGQQFADLKRQGTQGVENARRNVSGALHDLEVRIEQVSDRYGAWDAARERRFNARVAEAAAQLKLWNAQTDAHQAEGAMQYQADLATLKQRIEVAQAKYKDWKTRTDQQTEDGLAAASRQLDDAFQSTSQKFKTR